LIVSPDWRIWAVLNLWKNACKRDGILHFSTNYVNFKLLKSNLLGTHLTSGGCHSPFTHLDKPSSRSSANSSPCLQTIFIVGL
jgi:hypothetical protein